MLGVMIVSADAAGEETIERGVVKCGYRVVKKLGLRADIFNEARRDNPDALVVKVDNPSADLLEQMRLVNEVLSKPTVVFAKESNALLVEKAVNAGVSAYVVDGLSSDRIKSVLDIAFARNKSIRAMREELSKTKQSLADRKYIDKAKGLLISQRNMTEEEAYRMLRKMAMDSNKRVGQAAKEVISVFEALGAVSVDCA